jgi:SAM-dependent methyltransferase
MPDRAKKLIGSVYSAAAEKIYEPLVVRRTFPLLGGDLPELALEQGRRAATLAQGRPILDMPVGTAYFTAQIAREHSGLMVGCDIARGMVEKTASLAASGSLDGLVAVQADAHHLPFRDGSFVAVLCHQGLQVIPGLTPTVEELARVTMPGGMLYVTVLTLPASRLLPRSAARHLPTMLRSGMDVAEELSGAGLYVTSIRHRRFATLLEALKPVP